MNEIKNAVEPMKQLSVNNAVAFMEKRIAFYAVRLQEAGWDKEILAPYPNGNMGRAEYMKRKMLREFVSSITEQDPNAEVSYKRNAPSYVLMSTEGIARVLKEVANDAALAFDAYVYKLNQKVGEVVQAEVITSWDLWMDSSLQVTKVDGSKEIWNTKCITNYSKYNKAFNQFPTRLKK